MPGVLIINHRLQDLLINPVFGAYLAVGTLISLLMGKYTLYDEVSLIFGLFCLTVLYQSAREVNTQTTCVQNLLDSPCPDFDTVCKVFFGQELVLRHLYIGPAISFIVGNSCASFPPFWDLCTF